jgi:hypothetical protein
MLEISHTVTIILDVYVGCRGKDNALKCWAVWKDYFFASRPKILKAALWSFARGNHEDCASYNGHHKDDRAWVAWSLFFSSTPLVTKEAECGIATKSVVGKTRIHTRRRAAVEYANYFSLTLIDQDVIQATMMTLCVLSAPGTLSVDYS